MARTKIDYGIDLGTTNSAISRMESGEPVIIKTDTLKDTLPSCIYFNKKKAIQVGDAEQIIKPDISVDPMTVVSKGAALFASTVDV